MKKVKNRVNEELLKENKIKKTKEKVLRYPRPLGLTNICNQVYLEPNPQNKEKLLQKRNNIIIQQYVTNGLYYNGVQVPINQMATYLNIHTTELLLRMNTEFTRIGKFFDGQEGHQLARAALLGSFFGILETQSLAKSQTRILAADQGQRYVPFLSGELNRAIKNEMDSYRPLMDVLKLLSDNPGTNIFIQNNTQSSTNNYLSPDQALKLIEAKQLPSLLTNPDLIPGKENELSHVPQVGAKFQNLNNIGIRYNGTENNSQAEDTEHEEVRD